MYFLQWAITFVSPCMRHSWEMTPLRALSLWQPPRVWLKKVSGVSALMNHRSGLSVGTCCACMFHLHTTLLEQPLHKLPVGLSDDGGRQIRQFGLSKVLPQAAGFLHVLLKTKQNPWVSAGEHAWAQSGPNNTVIKRDALSCCVCFFNTLALKAETLNISAHTHTLQLQVNTTVKNVCFHLTQIISISCVSLLSVSLLALYRTDDAAWPNWDKDGKIKTPQ